MRELLGKLNEALAKGRGLVMCSVVETRGSTPQKAGASMLVFADGSQAGTLGGGCVEAEVKRQALMVLAGNGESRADLLTFNLDDNYGWDDGLICGGRMSILAEPLIGGVLIGNELTDSATLAAYFRTFYTRVEQGLGCTEAVVTASQPDGTPLGSRFLFDETGTMLASLGVPEAPANIRDALLPLAKRPKPYQKTGVAYLPILPRITLLIVGGGHVGQAVAKLAAEVDFDIWVLDDREAYASSERFPSAQKHLVGDIGATLQEIVPTLSAGHFALIVTRGHAHDEEALYHLAGSAAGYVGMIGSKRKIKLIYEDLVARGISRSILERVHAPLGFNIGSQTVPEIAVSIIAELIACRNLGMTIPEARIQVKL